MRYRRRGWVCPPDQVANAIDSTVDLTPASTAPAENTRAGWAALLPNSDVPLIWERTPRHDECEDE